MTAATPLLSGSEFRGLYREKLNNQILERKMKLLVKYVDMRGGYTETVNFKTDVIDVETDRIIGFVHATRSPENAPYRHISLFSGKYKAEFSSSNSIAECEAFAKGVEVVLNHIVGMADPD